MAGTLHAEQGEELRRHEFLVVGIGRGPGHAQAVDLVEEDDGWGVLPDPLEEAPQRGLGLANPLRQERWPGDNLDVGPGFTGSVPLPPGPPEREGPMLAMLQILLATRPQGTYPDCVRWRTDPDG